VATADVQELLEGIYGSFGSGDASAWIDHLGDEVVGIGTDPDEWWDSPEVVARVAAEQVRIMSEAGITVTGGDARVSEDGNVVWVADRPVIHGGGGSHTAARLTLVAVRHGGHLRIAQFHLSVGATNEDVVGRELPIA
jgi:ketosteroid isomerase-like protein